MPQPTGRDEGAEGELLYPVPLHFGPATAVRGTIVALDQRWLLEQDLLEPYTRALGKESLAQVSPTEWLPFPDALAHWRALDALGIPPSRAFEAGRWVGERVHGVVLRTLVQLAGKVGFTPWMALSNCQKFWTRSWQGGGVVVRRQGTAAARLDVMNASVARSRFFRGSLLGTIAVGLEPFCRRVVVVEREEKMAADSVGIRIAWL